MNPRTRRLNADYETIRKFFDNHPFIHLLETKGTPPEHYTFQYNLTGLIPGDEENFQKGESHRAEIFLPADYPRRPPICRMLTPVFHPNIDPRKICIGDHWSAGESLGQLIIRIGEMICYQSYNIKSPLNARAAAWAEQNAALLPLLQADLTAGITQLQPG